MTNGDDSAFARDGKVYEQDVDRFPKAGLTKREYFAAMAMQGLLPLVNIHTDKEDCAADAVEMADRLIEALNK